MFEEQNVSLLKIGAITVVGSYISAKVSGWILDNAGLPPVGPDAVFWAVFLTKIGVGLMIMIPYVLMIRYLLKRWASRDGKR